MKRYIPIIILAGLAACTPAQLQTAQTDISVGIKSACADVMAANALNPNSPVAPWAVAPCGTAAAVAGLVQSSATIQWLGGIQAALSAPVAVAPVVPAS